MLLQREKREERREKREERREERGERREERREKREERKRREKREERETLVFWVRVNERSSINGYNSFISFALLQLALYSFLLIFLFYQ